MRRLVLEEGFRADGRSIGDVRPIWSRAGLLPRTHGSVLFTRGETQVGSGRRAGLGWAGLAVFGALACWVRWARWDVLGMVPWGGGCTDRQ